MSMTHAATADTTSAILTMDSAGRVISPIPELLPHHFRELHFGSGLLVETIKAAGIRSEHALPKVLALLEAKTFPAKALPCIVYPYTDDQGRNGYARIKPDHPRTIKGKPVKYESPRGQSNQVYLPPGVAAVLASPAQELLLTEGEKKALAATQTGFPCIGLVGVYGWKQGKKENFLPALDRVAWNNRAVYIVFDSDLPDKPEVQDAENRLAAQLTQRGAKVRCARIPSGPAGPDGAPVKQGLDDYLVAVAARGDDPAVALRRLLESAEEPTPVSSGEIRQEASEIDAIAEARRFHVKTEREGVPRLVYWRGTWLYWSKGAYGEVPPSEVRGQVIKHLDLGYYKIGQSHTSNVLDGLKAIALLPHRIEPPHWIGDGAPAWDSLDILACRNGLVHLPTLIAEKPDYMRPATPKLFTTAAVDYDFRPDPPRPDAWLEFLDDLWPDDPDSISALQEWFGYTLTPDTRLQKILLCVGPKRSGKGTIARVQRAMVGKENVCGPTLASLSQNFGLWPLVGKSVAIVSDARLGGKTDSQIVVERLLSISGEDALTIDRKNLEPITTKLHTRLMIFSNELPRLGDSSGALAGRMILLRLTRSFFGHEDHGLTDRLLTELPGILRWSIEGWRRLRERGRFVQPTAADELMTELNDLTSPVSVFLRECCNIGPAYEVRRSDLYDAYASWAKEHGRDRIEDEIGFGRSLRASLPSVRSPNRREDGGNRCRYYSGVGLK